MVRQAHQPAIPEPAASPVFKPKSIFHGKGEASRGLLEEILRKNAPFEKSPLPRESSHFEKRVNREYSEEDLYNPLILCENRQLISNHWQRTTNHSNVTDFLKMNFWGLI